MTFLFLTLERKKNPERSKQFALVRMGQVLGFDRLPEMKTLRRKLNELAAKGAKVMRELGKRRLKDLMISPYFIFLKSQIIALTFAS